MIAKPSEILGNKDAPHVIKFEYCGGWGYRRQVMTAITKIEQDQADGTLGKTNAFQYNLYKDKGRSGRLEVHLFLNSKDDTDNSKGIQLHSKVETGKFIDDDIKSFLKKLDDSLVKWKKESCKDGRSLVVMGGMKTDRYIPSQIVRTSIISEGQLFKTITWIFQ